MVSSVAQLARVVFRSSRVSNEHMNAGGRKRFGQGARHLIIHADDAGMCESVNRATIDAIENGVVSSCSILVPCPGFDEFAEYARDQPGKDFGVHLTLNSELDSFRWRPLSQPGDVPSLIDGEGYFWHTTKQVVRHVETNEAEVELRAQIEQARDAGISISHLDTHMFSLLVRADLSQLYLRLGQEYDLPILCARYNDEEDRHSHPGLTELQPELGRSGGHPVVDYLEWKNYFVDPARKRDYFLRVLESLSPGITEITIHCADNDPERYSRLPHAAAARQADREFFTSSEAADCIDQRNVNVTDWGRLRLALKGE